MSRIGKVPVNIPEKVEVSIKNNVVTVKGAKGTLTSTLNDNVVAVIEGKIINIVPKNIVLSYYSSRKEPEEVRQIIENLQ